MEKIDSNITEHTDSQEQYNVLVMLRVFNKLDEIVKWINKHQSCNK